MYGERIFQFHLSTMHFIFYFVALIAYLNCSVAVVSDCFSSEAEKQCNKKCSNLFPFNSECHYDLAIEEAWDLVASCLSYICRNETCMSKASKMYKPSLKTFDAVRWQIQQYITGSGGEAARRCMYNCSRYGCNLHKATYNCLRNNGCTEENVNFCMEWPKFFTMQQCKCFRRNYLSQPMWIGDLPKWLQNTIKFEDICWASKSTLEHIISDPSFKYEKADEDCKNTVKQT